jgi:ribonuclease-3
MAICAQCEDGANGLVAAAAEQTDKSSRARAAADRALSFPVADTHWIPGVKFMQRVDTLVTKYAAVSLARLDDPRTNQWFQVALSHNSIDKKWARVRKNLEFLGDAVIKLAVTTWLLQQYEHKTVAFLSPARDKLVSGILQQQLCINSGLNQLICVTPLARREGELLNQTTTENALEAFVGALCKTCGESTARSWYLGLLRHIVPRMDQMLSEQVPLNIMASLRKHRPDLRYEWVAPSATCRLHTVIIKETSGCTLGFGKGRTRREAGRMAARQVLRELQCGGTSAVLALNTNTAEAPKPSS